MFAVVSLVSTGNWKHFEFAYDYWGKQDQVLETENRKSKYEFVDRKSKSKSKKKLECHNNCYPKFDIIIKMNLLN